jgi:hypothetical protein
LFFGVFPASIFALFRFFKREDDFTLWMQILFFVVLVLFTIVKTKIVHYSSMCYFPLTFIASLTIWKIFSGEIRIKLSMRFLLAFTSVILGILIISISMIDILKEWIINKNWIKDGFAIGNLQASGNWTVFEPLLGIFWFIWIFSKNPSYSVKGIFISSLFFVYLTMIRITPRIEAYSQRAAIEFYHSVAGEDAYITTLGFKSYAQLFYGQVNPPVNKSVYEKEWILKGNTDKRSYIVFKINRKERYMKEYPDLKIIYEKNGFVFSMREPINKLAH